MIEDNVVYGGPCVEVPVYSSFATYVIEKLKENPDRTILINADTGHAMTSKAILQEIVNVAVGLKQMGVEKGDIVAISSENRNEFITAVIAAISCGATVTSINVLSTKEEIIHMLSISQPKVVFCSEAVLKRQLDTIKSIPEVKKIIQLNGELIHDDVILYKDVMIHTNVTEYTAEEVEGLTDVALIMNSSGTTGLPKGVMLTHMNILYGLKMFNNGRSCESYSTVLTVAPWYHVYGFLTTIEFIASNVLIVYLSGFNTEKYLSTIEEHRVDVLIAVPPIIVFLGKSPLVHEHDLSSVKMVWCAAAPLSAETTKLAMKSLPNCKGILQGYGMTETTLTVIKDLDSSNCSQKTGGCGYPLPGIRVKVVDVESRIKLGINQNGEICLKGPSNMKGYLGNEAATREAIDDEGYVKTGDIGYYDEDGYFFIVDRLKEIIKYKGHQVAPAIVENVILQHNAVAECGVVGTPDEVAGELPTAFVTLKTNAQVTKTELLEFTDQRLSPISRLRGGIIFIDKIPRNGSGKILRRELKLMLRKL
ncbi:hypothetical protein O3G_MSEX013144 [Manduca sexta]|uniref:Luciferin 4-monooxygenase n=1 Tax=Manduca sexta TaxID=7130 RepID=A0A921ZR15_MANSE|nr:hypothetical protein O3G_MSEX013144 [Manduca sexta]